MRLSMEILGIRFAPLNVPLERRLQTLAVACWFVILGFGNIYSTLITLYLLFYSRLALAVILYILWMWYDRDTSRKGGRRSHWVRNWTWWHYFRDYFPLKLVKTEDLDPECNYLFCVFPHGVLSSGAFGHFATDVTGFSTFFPGITPYVFTLDTHFMTPGFRELALSLGSCSSSAESISYILGSPGTGRAGVLIVGGASESLKCRPGTYHLVLKRRKGFVRLALKHGTPLVPVISFGETDLYDQVNNPEGSLLRQFQDACRKWTGVAPVLPIGRGFFQYSFGIAPRRSPVTTVVGKPMDVQKVSEPTIEQIEEVHEKFVNELTSLFEENKVKYLKNPENTFLVIE